MVKFRKAIALAAAALAAFACVAADDGFRPLFVGVAEVCGKRSVSVGTAYADALSRAGHLPVVLPRFGTDAQAEAVLSRLDLLLLAGGEDVVPARYGEKPSPRLGETNALRDGFEWRLLEIAKKRRLPVVGICRGMQILNVFYGGSLYQDLPSEFPAENVQHRHVHHPVEIAEGSLLARMTGARTATVNSEHHQAAKRVAPGFNVAAKSPEGVVEAIESRERPVLGVQFHPERLVVEEGSEAFLRFFRNLYMVGAGK